MIGERFACLDGRVVPAEEAAAADPRRADPVPRGLYETVLVTRDRPRLATAHAARMARASAVLGLSPLDPSRAEADLRDAAARAGGARGRLRLIRWTDGAATRTLLTLDPEPAPPPEVVLGIAPEPRPRDLDARRLKRIDAPDLDRTRAAAAAAGLFDLLVTDADGHVLEGAKTNVFWRTGRTFRTPSETLPLLPGIRRAWLLGALRRAGLEVLEVEARLPELLAAEEVLVTNAMLGVRRRVCLAAGIVGGESAREKHGPHAGE